MTESRRDWRSTVRANHIVSEKPAPRIVLLGASNVARSLSPLIATARNVLGIEGECDVLTAVGRGRSFGAWSKLFGRTLCGILQSEIWQALEREEDRGRPTFALITDIGNDLMYQHSVAQIVEWIGECIARLRRHEARIVMTALPMARISCIPPRQFVALRSTLFPRCSLSFDDLLSREGEIMSSVVELERAHYIPLIEQPREWYGFDPIHVRLRHYALAWRAILSHWRPEREIDDIALARPSFFRWLRLTRALPEEFRYFGVNFGRTQPAVMLRDGTRVWCY